MLEAENKLFIQTGPNYKKNSSIVHFSSNGSKPFALQRK